MNMKKKLIIILLIAIVGIVAYIGFMQPKSKVIFSKDLTAEINSKAKASDYIKSVKNGKLIEDADIDTSKTGRVDVEVTIESSGKTQAYNFKVKVSDTEPPKIQTPETVNFILGQPCDPEKFVRVTDNSGGKIDMKFSGEVSSERVGTHDIEVTAKDESGNKSEKKIKVKIIDFNSSTDDLEFVTSNGFIGKRKGGITKIDGTLIANKTFALPSGYGPGGLTDKASSAWDEMEKGAKAEGMDITVVSGYRSYSTQDSLYKQYIAQDGKKEADTYSARPGHSEHQTGLAADINDVEDKFENTPEGRWLKDNAYKYGWILRYTQGKQETTGYIFEPWHYRYVGKKLAKALYNDGDWITMEDYFGIPSKYVE